MKNVNLALLQVIVALVVWFAETTRSQKTWFDKDCGCAKNTGAALSVSPIGQWSACKDWTEEDGDDPGCYSGLQELLHECLQNNASADAMTKEETKPLESFSCMLYRRCESQGRTCDGYWSQWSNNGPCDCATSKRTQSRYCYKKGSGLQGGVLSIHCVGSKGDFEQNRTIPCISNECQSPPHSPDVRSSQAIKRPLFETTSASSRLHSTPEVTTNGVTTSERKDNGDGDGVNELGTQTIIIAGVAVGVAFLAMMMLAVTCLMRRRQDRPVEKNFSSAQLPPPPLPLSSDYASNTLRPSSLYRSYEHTDGAYDNPHGAYNTLPNHMRRAISVQAPHASQRFPPAPRDRSATAIAISEYSEPGVQINSPYNTLRQREPAKDGVYAVPIGTDEEIYWSIDEADPALTLHNSSRDIERNASDENQIPTSNEIEDVPLAST